MVRLVTPFRLLIAASGLLASCSSPEATSEVVVSVKNQKMGIYSEGILKKEYAISTSKFGLGDELNSYRTPLGKHEVIAKIGHGLPPGAVLKSRHWNGEVLKPNAPGRDPIVSRILWLNGLESENSNAKRRYIYIHGTPEESRLGQPASYGCIRMGIQDVVDAFNEVKIGDKVVITKKALPAGKPVLKDKPENIEPATVKLPAPPIDPKPVVLSAVPKISPPPAEAARAPEATPTSLLQRLFGGKDAAEPQAPEVAAEPKAKPSGPVSKPALLAAASQTLPSPVGSAVPLSEPTVPSSWLQRFFGSKHASAPASPEIAGTPDPAVQPELHPTAETKATPPAAGERSFLTRLFFGKKSAPASPQATGVDQVGPHKPKNVAREPRTSGLSPTRPQAVVADNARA